jgi:DNA repair photolyase
MDFINGKRKQVTNWCDWDIPLHWGGMSDPFQPCEKVHRASYECLKVFAATKYPFVVSTKGKLVATEEYLQLLKQCNCVVQISMVCDKYDKIETGAPTYQERLEMCKKVSKNCKRLIVRVQPYMTEVFTDVMNNLPKLKEVGVYGITIEGMKFISKKQGLEKLGGDMVYPVKTLLNHFTKIKARCQKLGLKFYCAENRLRWLGDSLTCCGCDGLEGFRPNNYNLCHFINGDKPAPTAAMQKINTAMSLRALFQNTGNMGFFKKQSFADFMKSEMLYKSQHKCLIPK